MGRQTKRKAPARLERERRQGKSRAPRRPEVISNSWFLLLALPLVLAGVLGWLWLRPGGGAPLAPSGADGPGPIGPVPQLAAARVVPTSERVVRGDLAVSFSVEPVNGAEEVSEVRFTLSDTATGRAIEPESRPSVWVDRMKGLPGEGGGETLTCEEKVRSYAQGTLGFRPDIDLNSYYVLALNEDASISVIDPLLGVTGISQLYSMVFLKSSGEDWAFGGDGKLLFVSMPQAGQVAAIDTESFEVLKNIDAGSHPVRLALQPDGRYLWVGNESPDRRKSGVTVIDTEKLEAVAQIRTGVGSHEIAFSSDVGLLHQHHEGGHAAGNHEKAPSGPTRLAFVTNREEGALSVIDVEWLENVHNIKVGRLPSGLAFSALSNAVYVGSEVEDTITVVDGARQEVIGEFKAAKGTRSLRFAPGGRWGFATSPNSNRVSIFDASTNQLAYSIEVSGEPASITFTDDYAYVGSRRTADVSLIDLAQLGRSASPPVSHVIGGQKAPAESPFRAAADAIFPLHGNHVLIANPADSYIYYYMEGMKAPMGGFQNYLRVPRAVTVVDRSIRQMGPGAYSARIKTASSGQYQAAFLLDSPRVVQCFDFTAEAVSSVAQEETGSSLELQLLGGGREIKVGESASLRFALVDSRSDKPVAGLSDVQVMATLASGLWSERYRAEPLGDGEYAVSLILPRPGIYSVLFAIPSRKVTFGQLSSLSLRATAGSDAR